MLFEKKFKNIEKEKGENKNHFNRTIQILLPTYYNPLSWTECVYHPAPKSSYAEASYMLYLNPHSKAVK